MRVLVSGGAGYIGSNMAAMLSRQGHRAVVYDNLSKGHRFAVRDVEFIKGDLADFDLLVETLTKYSIEAVMHFAAFIDVVESVEQPLRYYHNNVYGTRTVLEAMEAAGVERFVFSSTAAVYGIPVRVPVTEDLPAEPISPYGETKLASERMCHWQSEAGRLRYASLRYFNAAGAGFGSSLGEDHRPESHLIPLTIQAAMGRCDCVKIFGTDYDTPDGTCIRDYTHIEDLCRAHLLALEKLDESRELIYNLGNGRGYSVREVIETVRKVSGKDFKIVETERRQADPPVLTSDASKAEQQLGWQRKYPDLESIVATAWQWHNKFPDGYPE